MSDTHLRALINSNLSTLDAASDLLSKIPADAYIQVPHPYFDSSLGKHLRHVLDHYICFQKGFEEGLIDYDQRQRDCQLETDRDYALQEINHLSLFLQGLKSGSTLQQPLKIVMCNDASAPEGEMTESSLGRELQFLQGHSVHHYALMAAIMGFFGHPVSDQFGLAPSTMVHENLAHKNLAHENPVKEIA